MKRLHHKELVHQCSLPPPDDIVVRYIDSGFCVYLRRRFRRFLTVSDTNPRSKSILRSSAAIRQEKARHLQHYYFMIHPFSDGRAYWEFFMTFVLLGLLVIIPIEMCSMEPIWYQKVPKLILDIICCFDVCINFFSGYYERNTKRIVLNASKVAKAYLMGFFWVDLLSSLPIELATIIFNQQHKVGFVRFFMCLKVLRYTTLMIYLNRIRDRKGYSIYKFKAYKLMITFLIALLWATTVIYVIAWNSKSWLPPETTPMRGLLLSCYKALYNLLLVGYGYTSIRNNKWDIAFSLVCLMLGVILQVYIYVEILRLLNKNLSAKNKYQHMVHQLHEYIRYKQLPENMRKRIFLYFDFRFEKKYYKEAEILSTLSENLREDITLHICQNLVESVDFFRDLPPSLLIRIVKSMKSEIYLTNDVIVRAGISGDCMYFIASGTTAVYTAGGREICHLADGGHFGEIALVMENEKRIASVVAIECCELFTLSRKDFRRAIAPYPELNKRIIAYAQSRLNRTMSYMDKNQEDVIHEDQLFAEDDYS